MGQAPQRRDAVVLVVNNDFHGFTSAEDGNTAYKGVYPGVAVCGVEMINCCA